MLRVIAWGTGAVGREMLTEILDHRPDLRIAGALVYSAEKNGVDVGVLVDRDPIGILATTDVDEILALDADCVLYTPRLARLDEVCALLASGKNVVTTAFLFHPRRLPTPDRDRLAAACRAGNASVHGSGLNPGNLSGVLPLALSGMSRTIDKITLQERADWSVYESTSITFDHMAFGRPVDQISPTASEFLAFNSSIFEEQVWFLADELNAGIDEVVATVEAVPAQEDHQIFEHLLHAGTTAGQRWSWSGRRAGETLVEIEALWTVGGEYPQHWPKPEHGWTLTIEGDPSMRAHFFALASSGTARAPIAEQDSTRAAVGSGARRPVGAVADQRPPQRSLGRCIDHVEHVLCDRLQRRQVGHLGCPIGRPTRVQDGDKVVVKRGHLGTHRLVRQAARAENLRNRGRDLIFGRGDQCRRRYRRRRIR